MKMIELEANTATYAGMLFATIVPSLLIGEQLQQVFPMLMKAPHFV